MNRRNFLKTGAAAVTLGTTPALADDGDFKAIAREAFLYSLPLIEMEIARTRVLATGLQQNTIFPRRALANHTSRGVTTPNNDTLYSVAWLDLSAGPVTISLPDFGKRYFSLQLMDMFSNSFAVLGTRMNGGKAATFEIVHPAATGKPNTIVSPTSRVWALGRTLVDGPDDLDAAHKAHSEVKVTGPSVATEQQDPAAARGRATDGVWHDFFAEANRLLRQNRPPTADSAILARIAPLAIDPDDRFARDKFSSEQQSAIEAGIADARAFLTGARFLGNDIEGWSYPGPTLGNFGTDYIVRAITARVGLAALPREEAMYMQPKGDAGDGLYDGRKAWRLHFDAGKLPPVNAFWSLTMYERMPDGRSYFTENPTNRYSIGDRTAGLKMAADGSLNIWMGHDDPGPERRSNWLPAPAGPFNLWLRAYLPRPELLNGSYRLPRIGPA